MPYNYFMRSTSHQSSVLEDIELYVTSTSRLVLRSQVVSNTESPEAGVKITLVYQRKGRNGSWEDVPTKSLSTLKSGEEVKLPLDTKTTLNLYNNLRNLYAINSQGGVRAGESSLVVGREDEIIRADDAGRARIIRSLISQDFSEEVWDALIESHPNLATKLSYARIHSERHRDLEEFSENLQQYREESWWQDFFERATWIFGYGLDYQILKPIESQAHVGGTNLTGKGMQISDYLNRTEGAVKFTVLVDIKKPHSLLLGKGPYRNGAWRLGEELTGGVAQLQANCFQWEMEARSEANQEILSRNGIYTIRPKGILVVGHWGQLDSYQKRNTFELFRKDIVNPEILTFDELFERAKFIVEHGPEGCSSSTH